MKKNKSLILSVIVIFALTIGRVATAQNQAESYVEGPMIGLVTDSVTYVNFILKKGNKGHIFHVALKNITKNTLLQSVGTKEFCMDDTCVYTSEFNNLIPQDRYIALIYKDNIVIDSSRTEIKFVSDTSIEDFSFLASGGAYMYLNSEKFKREKVFEQMSSEDANFVLWTGDNIYLPYNDLTDKTIYHYYLRYKTKSQQRKEFMKHFFHFGIWDDHDYGYDNSMKDFPNKDFASEMYKTFWPSSTYFNRDGGDIRSKYSYADVDFFLTDSRWYKTRYTNYGKEQMSWLKQQLIESKATFKFIVLSTATVYPWYYTTPSAETSAWETGERDELFNFIYEHKIPGVIIISGDKHKSYFAKYSPDCNSTYPIYEFMTPAATSEPNNSYYGYADIFAQFSNNGYGLISVSGSKGSRECRLTEKDSAGVVIYSMAINENELKVKGDDDFSKIDKKVIAKYDFTGNSKDSSGNNFDAQIDGPVLSYDRWGNNNSAYIFTKYPDKIYFPDTVLNEKVNFSISFWMRPDINNVGVLSAASSTIGNELMVYYGSTKKISFYIKDKGIYSTDSVLLNKWHNIVVTRNGITGEAVIYVDGRIESRDSLPVGAIEVVDGGFLAGNDQDGAGGGNLDENQQFKGMLDDVVFYDTVICKLKVKEIYDEGIKHISAITNDTICKPSNVDFIVTGANNGKYKWYKTKEGNSLITEETDSVLNTFISESKTYWVSADNFWKETERVPVTTIMAPKIYVDEDSLIYPSELNCWYGFDGNAEDKTQNYVGGTVNGPTLTQDREGNENSAYKFSVYPDMITLPSEIIDGAEEFTISFWVKTANAGRCIISAASSEYGNEFYIFASADSCIGISLNNSSKNYMYPKITDNKWHHILFTAECSSGSGVLWVDGEKAIDKNDYFLPGEMEVPDGAFIIGNDQDNPGGGGYQASQQFVGDIDDLIMFRRTLSEEEVLDIYNDRIIYKKPFEVTQSDTAVCNGDSIQIILSPVQNDIMYYLEDNNSNIIDKTTAKADSIIFNLKVTKNDTFAIVAQNRLGCKQKFTIRPKVTAVESPKPEIIFDGDNLCSNIIADSYSWIQNDIEINQKDKCIKLEGNGTYVLYVINNPKCISEPSEPFVFTEIENKNSNIKLYPNPVKDILTIEVDEDNGVKYKIINTVGEVVMEGDVLQGKINIDISHLPLGVFLVNISVKGENKISRIITKM